VMPPDRKFPRFIPRPGADITVTFGESVTSSLIPFADRYLSIPEDKRRGEMWRSGNNDCEKLRMLRIDLAEHMRKQVELLGAKVEGENRT
jgi:hypothetical protein